MMTMMAFGGSCREMLEGKFLFSTVALAYDPNRVYAFEEKEDLFCSLYHVFVIFQYWIAVRNITVK